MAAQLTLSGVLQNEAAKRLEAVLSAKADSPVFKGLGKPENALRFMRASLRGSYLFGRFAVPSYAAAVFGALSAFPPADETLGSMLSGVSEMVRGELFTNNIFGRHGERHAHFHDLSEAYATAGGDVREFWSFSELDAAYGFPYALEHSPLWSAGAARYARGLVNCCGDRLAVFIMMPANEALTPLIYPQALKYLCREERFAKFRRYLEAHVELDANDHGAVALEWLATFIARAKVPSSELRLATEKVLALFSNEEVRP
jgi:hypothetical protein